MVVEFWWTKSTQNYLAIRVATRHDVWLLLRIYIYTLGVAIDSNCGDQLGNGVLRDLQIYKEDNKKECQ